jgi:arylsulfatase A-like enzyme
VGRRRLVGGTVGNEVTGQFLDWLARGRRADRPFFAFINYFDAHAPYLPPAPYDSMYFGVRGSAGSGQLRAQYWQRLQQAFGPSPVPVNELEESLDAYDGAITFLDAQIDSLVRALGSRRLLDNTLVIVTSDHGELFGEHGIIQHGNSLYLPALYVPLYMRWPARVPSGRRVQSAVSLRNLARTIVDLAGVDAPAIPGVSLERTWAPGPFGLPEDTLFASLDYNSRLPRFPPSPVLRGAMASVVLDSLQYILNGDGLEELYHLGMDSWQLRNLAAEAGYGGRLGDYRQALTALLTRSRATGVQAGGR